MFFFLNYTPDPQSESVKSVQIGSDGEVGATTNSLYLQEGHQRLVSVPTPAGELLLLGDPVFRPGEVLEKQLFPQGRLSIDYLYQTIRGHYYWFLLQPGSLLCGSAFGSIFPVYYIRQNDQVLLCSSAFFLARRAGISTPNRRNLLERLLFNYPLFESTWWEGIQLLGAHCQLRLEGKQVHAEREFLIENHFGTGADHSRSSLERLAGLFESEATLFLPESRFGISFTGGFDGRTLLAAARRAGRTDFLTYSFGRADDADVAFPQAQTRHLGIPYHPILLDDRYVQQEALPAAEEFMKLTEYNGNYGRPHYQYAAKALGQQVDYLVTGNFGSELFRALHQPGVMMSENLIRIFSSSDDSWKDHLRRPQPDWDIAFFQNELDALIDQIERYLQPMQGWDANQRFYHFVFNEIFRKYFGPELIMQSNYLNNRTPFLSLPFFRALNETAWSGVHARLFEKVKSKRLKGQLFYAAFIRHTDPQLYRLPTSKGYSPADVLESWRLPRLLTGVLWQKFAKRPEHDTNAVDAFFQYNQAQLLHLIKPETDVILHGVGLVNRITQQNGNLEQAIKYLSIAAGWMAAQKITSSS